MSSVWERHSSAGDDEWDKPDSHGLEKGDADGWGTPPESKVDADGWGTPPQGMMTLFPSLSALQMFASGVLPSFNLFLFQQLLFFQLLPIPPTFSHIDTLIIA